MQFDDKPLERQNLHVSVVLDASGVHHKLNRLHLMDQDISNHQQTRHIYVHSKSSEYGLQNEILLRVFVEDFLRQETVLIFRLLSARQSLDPTVSQLLTKLFDRFVKKQKELLIEKKRIQEIDLNLV